MLIPQYVHEKVVDENGYFTAPWQQAITQIILYMQSNIGNEGFKIPEVSSASDSVDPAATGGQVAQLETAYGNQGDLDLDNQQGLITLGTVIFDPVEVNGGTSDDPNGQLKVLLGDGTFHPITNT